MYGKCPGQDVQNGQIELRECPDCGEEVEFFPNDFKLRCDRCGVMVYRERIPSCADWCAGARQCLGEEKWAQFKGSG